MKESYYQKKIMNSIIKNGGKAINGIYTVNGEADIQAGYQYEGKLLYASIEVKTPDAYNHMIKGLEVLDNNYKIIDMKKIKKHEVLQLAKLNETINKGGIGVLAYCIEQVDAFVKTKRVVL